MGTTRPRREVCAKVARRFLGEARSQALLHHRWAKLTDSVAVIERVMEAGDVGLGVHAVPHCACHKYSIENLNQEQFQP